MLDAVQPRVQLAIDGIREAVRRGDEGMTNLAATEQESGLLLRFELPHGATEAMIRWRFGAPPTGLDDPAAEAAKAPSQTCTQAEITSSPSATDRPLAM